MKIGRGLIRGAFFNFFGVKKDRFLYLLEANLTFLKQALVLLPRIDFLLNTKIN